MIQFYGFSRPTADVDVIELAPRDASEVLMSFAMQGGPLHRRHRIYLERVTVAAVPENYEDRLIEMFRGTYRNLRLMELDPYDLALSNWNETARRTATMSFS